MADSSVLSVARRAARRRKLLDGSETRLQKIKQLNDELKGSVGADISEKSQADSAGTTASSTPACIPQTQSEYAAEGEGSVSELPSEDSLERRPHQTDDDEITDAKWLEQESPCMGAESSVELETDIRRHEKFSKDEHLPRTALASEATVDGASEPEIPHDSEHKMGISHGADCHVGSFSATGHCVHSKDDTPRNIPQHSLCTSVNDIQNVGLPASSEGPFEPQRLEPQAIATDEPPAPQTRTVAVQPIHFLTTRELFVVLVAVLMRLMLAYEALQKLTGKSIFIPFVALQVTFFFTSSRKQQPPAGMLFRILSFAAMMASIPQTSIQKAQHVLTVIGQFFEDLALYLFVFVMTHEAVQLLS